MATIVERRIRAVVVDDEPLARLLIRKLLDPHPDIEVVAECGNAPDAVRQLSQEPADLVFLDVQMPEQDGFAVVEALGGRTPHVVFVTAYDQYAVRAFEMHAVDYLLKPFDRDRFESALSRAKSEIARDCGAELNRRLLEMLAERRTGAEDSGRLLLKCDGRVVFVRSQEVQWIEAQGNYVEVHAGRAKYLLREPIGSLEKRLDARRFRRIQRSVIVNLDHVLELQPWFRGDYKVLLRDGTELKLSHRYRESFDGCLGGRL